MNQLINTQLPKMISTKAISKLNQMTLEEFMEMIKNLNEYIRNTFFEIKTIVEVIKDLTKIPSYNNGWIDFVEVIAHKNNDDTDSNGVDDIEELKQYKLEKIEELISEKLNNAHIVQGHIQALQSALTSRINENINSLKNKKPLKNNIITNNNSSSPITVKMKPECYACVWFDEAKGMNQEECKTCTNSKDENG